MKKVLVFLIISAMFSLGCSAARSLYVTDQYEKNPLKMNKRIIVVGKAPSSSTKLSGLVTDMFADLVKQRKNYIVYGKAPYTNQWQQKCNAKVTGVMLLEVVRYKIKSGSVQLKMEVSQYDCTTKKVLWVVSGEGSWNSNQSHLKELIAQYKEKYGNSSRTFTGPVFNLITEILKVIPDPKLTEDESDTKIDVEAFSPGVKIERRFYM